MTTIIYRQLQTRKKSKYGAKRTVVEGIKFDSKKEANRWVQLRAMEEIGLIKELVRQPAFPLAKVIDGTDYVVRTPCGRCMSYFADFAYYQEGKLIVEDVKGIDTPVSRLKRAIVKMFYGIDVVLI